MSRATSRQPHAAHHAALPLRAGCRSTITSAASTTVAADGVGQRSHGVEQRMGHHVTVVNPRGWRMSALDLRRPRSDSAPRPGCAARPGPDALRRRGRGRGRAAPTHGHRAVRRGRGAGIGPGQLRRRAGRSPAGRHGRAGRGFAPPTVPGHAGEVVAGRIDGRAVLVLAGRVHLYEGHDVHQVCHGVRMAAAAGVRRGRADQRGRRHRPRAARSDRWCASPTTST